MERFPVELLYILGFIAIVLFNFIAQRAARRRQQQAEAQALVPSAPPPSEERPASAPVLVPRPAPAPARAEAPLPRRVHPVRALLQDRRDLRRAVILSIVLGPCRAQEPPRP